MEYSKRDLTYQHDSLNAFLGAINFHTHWQSSSSLTPELLHFSYGLCAEYRTEDEIRLHLDWFQKAIPQRRPQFPSWTWAGWGGPVRFTEVGITLQRPGEESGHLRPLHHLRWRLSWDSQGHTPDNIWGLADHVWRWWAPKRGHLSLVPSYVAQLQITCLAVPVGFQKVQLTRDQSERNTEIHFPNRSGYGTRTFDVKRSDLPKENTAVLQIWKGIYVATRARLDQKPEIHDHVIGLVFAGKGFQYRLDEITFGCLLVRQLDPEGIYERVGILPCIPHYCTENTSLFDPLPGTAFLDETGRVLDKVEISRREWDMPFEDVGERRAVTLV